MPLVVAYGVVWGFSNIFSVLSAESQAAALGKFLLFTVLCCAFTLLAFYVCCYVVKIVSGFFKGSSDLKRIQLAWAWSSSMFLVTKIITMPLFLMQMPEGGTLEGVSVTAIGVSLVLGLLALVLYIWSIVSSVKVTSEALQLSVAKTLVVNFIAGIALMALYTTVFATILGLGLIAVVGLSS